MDSLSTWFHDTWIWIENLSPLIVASFSFVVGVLVTISRDYFSHRLALRRDDRNRRINNENAKREKLESIKLNMRQREIIEKCKSSDQNQFEILFVENIAEIRKGSDGSVIIESKNGGLFRHDLQLLEERGYILITHMNTDILDFLLADPQPDEGT